MTTWALVTDNEGSEFLIDPANAWRITSEFTLEKEDGGTEKFVRIRRDKTGETLDVLAERMD